MWFLCSAIETMIILIQCQDKVGLVAAICRCVAQPQHQHYFNAGVCEYYRQPLFCTHRNAFQPLSETLKEELTTVLPGEALIQVNPLPQKKIVVLVTKEHHCLSDILIRNHFKTLGATVQCVIGNHDSTPICFAINLTFRFILFPMKQKDKATFENELQQLIKLHINLTTLFLRNLCAFFALFVANFPLQIINIHHSFLPAFIGANPYRQAYDRGVKMIGATAHFVTNDLDEGPIIAQQIIPVNHSFSQPI